MGLDTTHGCWNGGYGAFNKFRYGLGKLIGINLDDYYGYRNSDKTPPYKDLVTINNGIGPLLDHSDCDGELTPSECQRIFDGMQQIVDDSKNDIKLKDDVDDYQYNVYEINEEKWLSMKIHKFMDGCREAIVANENVEFY